MAGRLLSAHSTQPSIKVLKSALKIDNENEKLNVDTNLNNNTQQSMSGTMHNPQSPSIKHTEIMEITDISKSPYVPVYKHNYVNSLTTTSSTGNIRKQLKPTSSSSCSPPLPSPPPSLLESNAIIEENKMIVSCSHNDSIVDIVACDDCNENVVKNSCDKKQQFETNIANISIENVSNNSDDIEYTDNDLDEALAENDGDVNKLLEKKKRENEEVVDEEEEEPMTPINGSTFDIAEGHYLPMTPKKAIISSSASETSILAMDILNSIRSSTDAIEENPYIEMSSGLSNASEKQQQHSTYELVMVSGKKDSNEPLYMELAAQNSHHAAAMKQKSSKKSPQEHKASTSSSSSKKRHSDKSQSRIKKRHDLPDILKQSQQNYGKSDSSSDADDEDMSKEPMALKSRTRFSLSDTFRPASYYLGASTSSSIHKNVPLAECIDSSDSEIVPPPPIPSTSPPDTEDIFSSENFNTIKRNSTTSNEIIHHRTMSAGSSSQLSEQRASRFSLQDQLYKQQQQQPSASSSSSAYLSAIPQFEKLKNAKLFSTASNCSINTDDGSNTSSDFDLYNKIKLQSPSISADSLNQSQSSLTDSSPRPRPISSDDEALFKFEEQNANDKLDQYLNNLETSDLFYSKEQTTWLTQNLKSNNSGLIDPMALHYENINLLEEQQNNQQKTLYYDSLEDVSNKGGGGEEASSSSRKTSQGYSGVGWVGSNKSLNNNPTNYPLEIIHKKSQSFPWMSAGGHEQSNQQMKEIIQPLKEKNLSIHDALHQTTEIIDQDASSTVFEMTQPSHSRNNSNLSDTAPYYYSDLASEAIEKLNNQRDLTLKKNNSNYISHIHNVITSNKQQLTSILKDQAEKEQGIDSRNIYEQGSGRLQKLINKDESTLLATDFANNKIYYHEKNINVDNAAAAYSSNAAIDGAVVGSIDNLLYSKSGGNLDCTSTNVECDQQWEEDAIWRESLRRVSQRHARSLDDLDRIESVTKARITDADKKWGITTPTNSNCNTKMRTKITREVTYVNEDYQRSLPRKKKNFENSSPTTTSTSKLDENDVYVQLAPSATSPSDVYEILRDDSNIDRENIRQWDLMSSGLVKSSSIGSRNQHSQVFNKNHPSTSGTLPSSIMKSPKRNGN